MFTVESNSGPAARSRRGASGTTGMLVAGVTTVLVAGLWIAHSRSMGTAVVIRAAEGVSVPADIVDYAQHWLTSDAACLRALEVLARSHALPTAAELRELRAEILFEPVRSSDQSSVVRLRFCGKSDLGPELVRELAAQFATTGTQRLRQRWRTQEVQARQGLHAAQHDLRRLTHEMDQIGTQIQELQKQVRSARIENRGRQNCSVVTASVASPKRTRDALQLVQLLENRSHLLQQAAGAQDLVERYSRELETADERMRALMAVRLVATADRSSGVTLSLGPMAAMAVLVGVTLARSATRASLRRSTATLLSRRDVSRELGIPMVSFSASGHAAATC